MNFGNGKDSAHLITKHHQNDLQKSVKLMTFQMSLLVLIIGKVHIRSQKSEVGNLNCLSRNQGLMFSVAMENMCTSHVLM